MKSSTQGPGASVFGRITIANKLLLLTINAIIGVLLVTGFLLVQERDGMLKERETSVKQAVETAYGTLAYYQGRVEKNEMSLEEAQKSAMDAVRTMRYGDGDVEYFWINDMALKMIMHPIKPALDKTDLSDNKDPTGKRLFVDMVNIVKKQGAGFEFYMWP
jgi:methyl-accepting chemotaxis protein